MRRLVHVIALAVLAGACGSAGTTSGGVRQVHLAFVYAVAGVAALDEMALGARAAAADSPGVTLDVAAPQGPAGNTPAEVGMFRAAIRTARDGVALDFNQTDAFVQPLQEARAAGVPLVTVDTPPPPSSGVGTYVGNSNFELGQQLADDMLDAIPPGAAGDVVIGTPLPGFPVMDQRITGMLQVLKQQRPEVRVEGPFSSTALPQSNLAAWTAEVQQYPDAIAYLAPSDVDAASLAELERRSGRHLLVGACDIRDDALQGIKQGLVHTLVSPEHWLKGYIAVRLLAQRAQAGKALPQGWWNPGTLVVNQSNVDEVIARQRDAASRDAWFAARAERQLADRARYVKPLSSAI